MPAKAGIQNTLKKLDSRLRGNDERMVFSRVPKRVTPLYTLVDARTHAFKWIANAIPIERDLR